MSKVYYLHTSKSPFVKAGVVPPATIALKMENGIFTYGVSICSKHDNFSKKYGREIAENRMKQEFAKIEVPKVLSTVSEKQACILQLHNLAATLIVKNKKWKKRVTAFNLTHKKVELPQTN